MRKRQGSSKALLIIHAITFLISIIFSASLPKLLGVQDYIVVMQISALINFLLPICAFASPTLFIKKYNFTDRLSLFRQVLKLYSLGTLTVLISIFIFFNFLGEIDYKIAVHTFVITMFTSFLVGITTFARVESKVLLYAVSTILIKLNVLVIVSVFYGSESLSTSQFLAVWSYSSVFVFLLSLILMKSPVKNALMNVGVEANHEIENFKQMLVFCSPIVFANVLTMLLPFFERYILDGLIDKDGLALYLFNIDILSKVSSILLLVLKVVIYPRIMLSNKNAQIKLFSSYLKNVFFICLIVILSSPLISFVYGLLIKGVLGYVNYYDMGVSLFLISYSMIVPLNYILSIGLVITNKNKFLMISTSLTLIMHMIGVNILSSNYGVLGVSFSLFFSIVITSLVLYFYTKVKVNEYEKNYCKIH